MIMYGDTFTTKFKELCGSSAVAPELNKLYNRTLVLIEVRGRTGGTLDHVNNPHDCQDWTQFPELKVMVASVSGLLSMTDDARRLFWNVLHAPQLQQLIVWNDVARVIRADEHAALFLGLVEVVNRRRDSDAVRLTKIHLPLFNPSENRHAFAYPPGVLTALQGLNPTALTVQLLSAQLPPAVPGQVPLRARYLGLGNLVWDVSEDMRDTLESNLQTILDDHQNKFIGFSVAHVNLRDVPMVVRDVNRMPPGRIVFVTLYDFSCAHSDMERIGSIAQAERMSVALLGPIGSPADIGNTLNDLLRSSYYPTTDQYGAEETKTAFLFVELNESFGNKTTMPTLEATIAQNILTFLDRFIPPVNQWGELPRTLHQRWFEVLEQSLWENCMSCWTWFPC